MQADLRVEQSQGTYIYRRVVNKVISEMSGTGDFPQMRRLVWAFAARIADFFNEIKYVNNKFIKMQNRATITLFLGTCMCVCALMHSKDPPCAVSWGQTDTTRSAQQFVKMFHFEEFDVFDW